VNVVKHLKTCKTGSAECFSVTSNTMLIRFFIRFYCELLLRMLMKGELSMTGLGLVSLQSQLMVKLLLFLQIPCTVSLAEMPRDLRSA
jgi:hypothetical protein